MASAYNADVARGQYKKKGTDDAAAGDGRRRLLRTRTVASLLRDVAAARVAAAAAHFYHATGVQRPAPRVLPVNGVAAARARPGSTGAAGWALPPLEILFLKIDVEGHEPQVLQGAEALFKARRVRTLVVEANLRNPETKTMLLRLVTGHRYAMRALGPVIGRCRRRGGGARGAHSNKGGHITHEAQFEAWAKCIVELPVYHGKVDLRFDRMVD